MVISHSITCGTQGILVANRFSDDITLLKQATS
jgi:hypothetical protein